MFLRTAVGETKQISKERAANAVFKMMVDSSSSVDCYNEQSSMITEHQQRQADETVTINYF